MRGKKQAGVVNEWLRVLLVAVVLVAGCFQTKAPMVSAAEEVQIVPHLSSATVKNGETLTVSALVRAGENLATITATIMAVDHPAGVAEIVAAVPLHPKSGLLAPGGVAMYEGQWQAVGLRETEYCVRVDVITASGKTITDTRLRFSDPVFGQTTVGETAYPDGGMNFLGDVVLDAEYYITCGVTDPEGIYAYYGLADQPSKIVKIDLHTLTRVDALTLNSGENDIQAAVLDATGRYAYWGTRTSPGRIVKIDLATFTRVGTLTLVEGLNDLRTAVLEPVDNVAYFGTGTDPGAIVKIDLATFTVIEVLTLATGESRPSCAIVDEGYAFFGVQSDPGKIVKIDISTFTRVAALTLEPSESQISAAFLDASAHQGYFGIDGNPARVVKIDLPSLTRIEAVELAAGETTFGAAAFDEPRQCAYLGLAQNPAMVLKLDVASFTISSRLSLTRRNTFTAMIHPSSQFAVVSTQDFLQYVEKINLENFTVIQDLELLPGAMGLLCGVIDPVGEFGYFASYSSPSRLSKINLESMQWVETLTLAAGEDYVTTAIMDPAGTFACFGTTTSPGKVLKINLAEFVPDGVVTLNSGEDEISSAVIDPFGTFAYVGVATSPGIIVKINLASLTRVGALTLEAGENHLRAAAISPDGSFAYFGTASNPAKIVKINLGTLQRVEAIALPSDEHTIVGAAIHPDGLTGYFGSATGKVVVVSLNPLTRIGVIDIGYLGIETMVAAPTGDYVYVGTQGNQPNTLIKLDLSSLAVAGELPMTDYNSSLVSAILDPGGRCAYLGTAFNPCRVIKVGLDDQTGVIQGTKAQLASPAWCDNVYFYAHEAGDTIRLGIYQQPIGGDLPSLVWQSPSIPVSSAGWLTTPIAIGSPNTLVLTPSDYWLCWQTDSTAQMASYQEGLPGDGIQQGYDYGLFPTRLGNERLTAEQWSMYVAYSAVTYTPTMPATPSPTTTFTPTPIDTPAPSPTLTVTPSPILPTKTPTLTVTPAPTLSPTIEPSPTEVPFGFCYLYLNNSIFHPGDQFWLVHYISSPIDERQRILFVVLDVYGDYWFYPSWFHYEAPDYRIDFTEITVIQGDNIFEILNFTWPDTGADQVAGLRLWSATTTADLSLTCDVCMAEFGYGPAPWPTPTATEPPTVPPASTRTPPPTLTPSVTPTATPWMAWQGEQEVNLGFVDLGNCSKEKDSHAGIVSNLGGSPLTVTVSFEGPQSGNFGFSRDALGQPCTFTVAPNEELDLVVYFCPADFAFISCDMRLHPSSSQNDVVVLVYGYMPL